MFSHEGVRGGKFRRFIKKDDQMIIGLEQKMQDHIKFVSDIATTHLVNNQWTKKQYDELDVVTFNKVNFIDRLNKPISKPTLPPPNQYENAQRFEKNSAL